MSQVAAAAAMAHTTLADVVAQAKTLAVSVQQAVSNVAQTAAEGIADAQNGLGRVTLSSSISLYLSVSQFLFSVPLSISISVFVDLFLLRVLSVVLCLFLYWC